jgi:hypothetical protein
MTTDSVAAAGPASDRAGKRPDLAQPDPRAATFAWARRGNPCRDDLCLGLDGPPICSATEATDLPEVALARWWTGVSTPTILQVAEGARLLT